MNVLMIRIFELPEFISFTVSMIFSFCIYPLLKTRSSNCVLWIKWHLRKSDVVGSNRINFSEMSIEPIVDNRLFWSLYIISFTVLLVVDNSGKLIICGAPGRRSSERNRTCACGYPDRDNISSTVTAISPEKSYPQCWPSYWRLHSPASFSGGLT